MHEPILDALRRGAHDQALAAANAVVAADGNDARAHHLLSLAQRAMGDTGAALASIERAIALAPDDAGLHFQRAGLLIGEREIARAEAALTRTIELDPNRFGAYIVQAELAIGRGDLDEAERLAKLAARIAPGHPTLGAVDGMIALRRGDADRALAVISAAQAQAPEDLQLLNALAFAYLAKGHFAFAEQTLLRMRELNLDSRAHRRLLAEVIHRQGRPAEALEALVPLLEDPEQATPSNLRFAGELELVLQRPGDAVPWLRRALLTAPSDGRALALIMEAWRRLDDQADARSTLDTVLAAAPDIDQLWQARIAVERSVEEAGAVLERWEAALPESMAALEARLSLQLAAGDVAAGERTARAIVERRPGHIASEGRLLDLLMQRDPQAAVQRVEELMALPKDEAMQRFLRGWLALAHDGADNPAEAAAGWAALHAEGAERMIPLPAWTAAAAPHAAAATPPEPAPAVAFLAGLPGTGVENVARLLDALVPAFRADRFGGRPPDDPLQNIHTLPRLAAGETAAGEVAAAWGAQLPARGIDNGAIIDWLLWWDNALLDVVAAHLPQARVLLCLRDPRDMLLNWLAFGAPMPLRLGTPQAAADWLAQGLAHVAELHERDLHPHRLLRLDETVNDPAALAAQIGEALDLPLPAQPGLLGGRRFEAGRWRAYADALAAPFATLTPVAVRLGYSAT